MKFILAVIACIAVVISSYVFAALAAHLYAGDPLLYDLYLLDPWLRGWISALLFSAIMQT